MSTEQEIDARIAELDRLGRVIDAASQVVYAAATGAPVIHTDMRPSYRVGEREWPRRPPPWFTLRLYDGAIWYVPEPPPPTQARGGGRS